jgi:uncharacterized protein
MIAKRKIRTRLEMLKRFVTFHILHSNDSPSKIARGVAIGLFIAWIPALGLHIILCVALAALLKANKFAAFASVWISNPFTFAAIYYPNFLFGRMLLRPFVKAAQHHPSARQLWRQLNITEHTGHIISLDFWRSLFNLFWHYTWDLWLGSIVLGLIVAGLGYIVTYEIIVRHRKANPHRRHEIK